MWNVKATCDFNDWDGLRQKIKTHGVRNSLLLAPMPTASTAQILGNNEAIEPYTSNIYTRRVLSGEFQVNRLIGLNLFGNFCILKILMLDWLCEHNFTYQSNGIYEYITQCVS